MSFKLLHTADLHLGMTFKNRNYPEELRRQLVEARFACLEKLVNLAEEEQCRLLIIAGDLFHRVNIAAADISRVVNILKRFSGVSALLPGNHDYFEPHSPLWGSLSELASEEIIVLKEERPYCLSEHGVEAVLYPAPCDGKHSAENNLGWIGRLEDRPQAAWHIGVAHGTVRGVSPDFNEQYFPMEESELAACKLDHWCLGHTHVPYPNLKETGHRPFIFSGTPEPDGFDCLHVGSVWITELEAGGSSYSKQIQTGQFRFVELEKTVESSADLRALTSEQEAGGDKTLVKLRLRGMLPEADYAERITILRQIEEKVIYLETDISELIMQIDAAVIDDKYPQGSFPHRLLKRLSDKAEPEAVQVAYRLIEDLLKEVRK
jgi:DNA repair protein SbcD/Mre11